jgi:hypothetical protein
MMTKLILQICAATLLAATTTEAFSVVPSTTRGVSSTTSASAAFSLSSRRQNKFQPLFMAASEGSEDAKSEVETTEETASAEDEKAVEADLVEDDEPVVEGTEPAADVEAEAEEPAEDPELVALKEEISTMEKTLKERRVQVALTADTADEFSSAGYARKVAEMEMMRRNKRVSTKLILGWDRVGCLWRLECSKSKYRV